MKTATVGTRKRYPQLTESNKKPKKLLDKSVDNSVENPVDNPVEKNGISTYARRT